MLGGHTGGFIRIDNDCLIYRFVVQGFMNLKLNRFKLVGYVQSR